MKNISIIDIIPHRPPFVMIDTLLYADKEKARSTFYIQPDNLFVENGFFGSRHYRKYRSNMRCTNWLYQQRRCCKNRRIGIY